jgi:hypothetical protein
LDGDAFASQSFALARNLLRAGDERPKPNGERLAAYTEAKRESFELTLFSPAPIEEDLEIVRLTTSLSWLSDKLGFDDPTVRAVLAGKSPLERAAEVIGGTRVRDVAVRHQLYEGGAVAVAAAKDPMIEFARTIDAEARALTLAIEAEKEKVKQAQGELARARFALHGTEQYPDATGTLRLSYGRVRGISGPEAVPAFTTYAGLFERAEQHAEKPPFNLPPRWVQQRGALDPATTFNFISDCDIIGGNSGSPVLNRAGEFVGIIFDGNLASLSLDLAYEDRQARAVSVTADGIVAALRDVYGATALVDELHQGRRNSEL